MVMKVAALFSGGKDSTYAIWLAQKQGHEVVKLATAFGQPGSYMYHTVNIGLTLLQSRAMGIQLVSKHCAPGEDEVKELEALLRDLGVEGIVCGAIASEYQRSRVAKVCKELGLELIAPLWGIDEEKYMRDLVKDGVIDPTKVVRLALQNAASVASLMLTTQAMVAEKPEEKPEPAMPAGAPGMGGGGMGGMGGMM